MKQTYSLFRYVNRHGLVPSSHGAPAQEVEMVARSMEDAIERVRDLARMNGHNPDDYLPLEIYEIKSTSRVRSRKARAT